MSDGTLVKLAMMVPKVDKMIAIVLLVVNIFLPGIGTIVAAIMDGFDVKNVIFGCLQFLLAALLIGWVWAIFWSILMIKRSSIP